MVGLKEYELTFSYCNMEIMLIINANICEHIADKNGFVLHINML